MTTAAWITMVCVVGTIWGGLALILTVAFRKERKKAQKDQEIKPFPSG